LEDAEELQIGDWRLEIDCRLGDLGIEDSDLRDLQIVNFTIESTDRQSLNLQSIDNLQSQDLQF